MNSHMYITRNAARGHGKSATAVPTRIVAGETATPADQSPVAQTGTAALWWFVDETTPGHDTPGRRCVM
jgi:hypothetical protein